MFPIILILYMSSKLLKVPAKNLMHHLILHWLLKFFCKNGRAIVAALKDSPVNIVSLSLHKWLLKLSFLRLLV